MLQPLRLLALILAVGTLPAAAQEANRTDRAPQVASDATGYANALLFPEHRKALAEDSGIDLHLIYTTESSTGLTDTARGTRYTGQIEIGGKFDLDKLAGVKGGVFNIVAVNREGRDLSTDVIHNLFRVQEVYGANKDMRLLLLTYQQTFADGRADVLVGRTNIGQDFASSSLYCNFQNNGLCGRPASLPANGGFLTYPRSAWGGRARVKPIVGDSYIQAGAYEVNPHLDGSDGLEFTGKGDTGVVFPVEGAYVTGSDKAGTLGTYKVGAYYDTSRTTDQLNNARGLPVATAGGSYRQYRGRFTWYVFADQMLFRFGGDPKRPFIVLAGYTHAPSDRSLIANEEYVGIVMKGVLAARSGDTLSLLALTGRISPDLQRDEFLRRIQGAALAVQGREHVLEANYNVRVARWLHVVPGVQHIFNIDADPARHDATVIDLKTSVNF